MRTAERTRTMTGGNHAVRHDDDAFAARALRHLDDLSRFARSLTHAPDEADDLVQDTFLLAMRGRHTWREGGDMRRWLFTILKNAFLRSRSREQRIESLDDEPTDDTLRAARLHHDLAASSAGWLDAPDVADAIHAAVLALPAPFRLAIVLVDMEGYSYEDAADTLGVAVGTVRSRLFRARRLLREQLVLHARDAGLAGDATADMPPTSGSNADTALRGVTP